MVHVHFKKKVMPPGCSNLYKLHIFFQTHTAPVSFQLLHDWHLLHGHLMRCPGPKPRTQAPCGALPWDEKVVAITQDAFLPCPTSPMEIWWIFSLEGFKKNCKKEDKNMKCSSQKKEKNPYRGCYFPINLCQNPGNGKSWLLNLWQFHDVGIAHRSWQYRPKHHLLACAAWPGSGKPTLAFKPKTHHLKATSLRLRVPSDCNFGKLNFFVA